MFTTNQIEEIRQKLQLGGEKDTSFPDASAIKGNEILALVQEGVNKKMTMKEFARFVKKYIDNLGNIEDEGGVDVTLFDAAITAYASNAPEASIDYNEGLFSFKVGLPKGAKGDKGDRGPVGPKGEDGETSVGSRTVFAYKSSSTKPNKPTGGSWDPRTNTVRYPANWGSSDNLTGTVWVSSKVFYTDSSLDSEWSDPFQITGEKGDKGADGVTTEFIYKLTKNDIIEPDVPATNNQNDWVPENEGWTDNPTGISETMKAEWVCCRNLLDDGTWGPWIGPSLWSKWGDKGQDGDGVEYIYKRTKTATPPNAGEGWTYPSDWLTNEEYQNTTKEYKPSTWEDEPIGVEPDEYKWEWVCTRKYKDYTYTNSEGETVTEKKWLPFSNPALWSHYGADAIGESGISLRVEYAVTDSTSNVPVFNADNIDPGTNWSRVKPLNYDTTQALWSISTYVDSNNQLAEYTIYETDENGDYVLDSSGNRIEKTTKGWQGPTLESGVIITSKTVAYSTTAFALCATTSPTPPDVNVSVEQESYGQFTDIDGSTVHWIDYPNSPETDTKRWYSCVGKVNGATGIITEWGTVAPFFGKDGQDGSAQESRYLERRLFAASNNPGIADKTARDPKTSSGASYLLPPNIPTVESGQQMWAIEAWILPGSVLADTGWSDPWPISGERGPRGYTGATGERGPQGLTGIPGVTIDTRYALGDENGVKAATWNSTVKTDIDPSEYGWLTIAPSVTEDYPYIWCIQSRIINVRTTSSSNDFTQAFEDADEGWSEPFRLNGIDGIEGTNGVGIRKVDEYYMASDKSSGVTKDDTGWNVANTIPTLTEDEPYLWNKEIITYTDDSTYETDAALIGSLGSDGRGIVGITDYYIITNSGTGIKSPTTKDDMGEWVKYADLGRNVSADEPYLWNCELIQYDKVGGSNNLDYEFTEAALIASYTESAKGDRGPVIYPAGIYSNTKIYTKTERAVPYVWDADSQCYYVLNCDRWLGTEHNDLTPGLAYEDHGSLYWDKFEMFEAVYADVGVFNQSLIGSAVFWEEYIFSQQGIDTDGNASAHFENFMLDEDGNATTHPYSTLSLFRPNFCINCKTGESTFAKGFVSFLADGTVMLGNTTNGNPNQNQNPNNCAFLAAPNAGAAIANNVIRVATDGTVYIGKPGGTTCKFNTDGSGELAGGVISWTEDGELYLGNYKVLDDKTLYVETENGSILLGKDCISFNDINGEVCKIGLGTNRGLTYGYGKFSVNDYGVITKQGEPQHHELTVDNSTYSPYLISSRKHQVNVYANDCTFEIDGEQIEGYEVGESLVIHHIGGLVPFILKSSTGYGFTNGSYSIGGGINIYPGEMVILTKTFSGQLLINIIPAVDPSR